MNASTVVRTLRGFFVIAPARKYSLPADSSSVTGLAHGRAFRKDGGSVMMRFPIASNLNKRVRVASIMYRAKAKKDYIRLSIICVVYDPQKKVNGGGLYIRVFRRQAFFSAIAAKRFLPIHIKRSYVNIPYSRFGSGDIHNRVSMIYSADEGSGFAKPIMYSFLHGFKGHGKSRSLRVLKEVEGTAYVRQSARNRVYLTFRRSNRSDDYWLNKKITLAFWLSMPFRWRKVILLYEKESMKYDESASVLYEALIDEGHKRVYFVMDMDSPQAELIPDKYCKRILKKHSLKHYMYFFISRTFLGTEMPAHALDLRVANKHAVRKIHGNKIRYVFLQHGVMMMVSLGSKTRAAARKYGGNLPAFSRTVVSSQVEADHFVEHGDYDQEDLYVCGLSKFDRAYRDKGADRIVIMPTWRPWEYNQVRTDPESTPYYKMLEDMIDAVPERLRDKIVLLPHNLFMRELQDSPLNKYTTEEKSYDRIMRSTDLLITDYSSIAFDAFYRGANVIFWWKEKDYCMEQYDGFLMLNKRNSFADITNSTEELRSAIGNLYKRPQSKRAVKKFKKLVTFSDGNNTQRLIEMLKEDNLL